MKSTKKEEVKEEPKHTDTGVPMPDTPAGIKPESPATPTIPNVSGEDGPVVDPLAPANKKK